MDTRLTLEITFERKQSKYAALIQDQMNNFKAVKFVNLSVSALGVFDQKSSPFIQMLKELNVDNSHQKYVIRKIIIWLRQMTHADWLISGLEKVILPAQESHLALSRNSSCPLV